MFLNIAKLHPAVAAEAEPDDSVDKAVSSLFHTYNVIHFNGFSRLMHSSIHHNLEGDKIEVQ